MNVSSITSTDPYQSPLGPTNNQKVREDFQSLASSLSSGDLTAAQQAFKSISSDAPGLLQNGAAAQGLSAVGEALQSGNITGAQQAFATLESSQHHHHHGHHTGSSEKPAPASGIGSTTDSALTDPTKTDIGTQINSLA